MATLKLDDDTVYTDLQTITHKLSPLKIQINHWAVEVAPQLHHLLAQDSLNDEEQTQVLVVFDEYFAQLISLMYALDWQSCGTVTTLAPSTECEHASP